MGSDRSHRPSPNGAVHLMSETVTIQFIAEAGRTIYGGGGGIGGFRDTVTRLAQANPLVLTIKAEAPLGCGIREDVMPAMREMAVRTGARIEVEANDTKFWAYPWDSLADLQDAVDRLYPESRIVAAHLVRPVPRVPTA